MRRPRVPSPRQTALQAKTVLVQLEGYALELDLTPRGPASLAARAALHFLTPPLAGLALRGFCLWRASSGLLVTPPRLQGDVAFLLPSHLASPDLSRAALQAVEQAILDAYSHTLS